jgi:hypothetical protein
MLSPGGLDRVEALKFLEALGPRVVVVGETAGALHGWPLVLDGSGGIDLLVHREDRGRVEDALGASSYREQFRLLDEVPGAWGYPDLARNAVAVEVEGVELQVAALVDCCASHTRRTPVTAVVSFRRSTRRCI